MVWPLLVKKKRVEREVTNSNFTIVDAFEDAERPLSQPWSLKIWNIVSKFETFLYDSISFVFSYFLRGAKAALSTAQTILSFNIALE